MRKKTIGEVLRLARVNQKLTLEDAAKKTDIKTDYLKALENNQYEKFRMPFTSVACYENTLGLWI